MESSKKTSFWKRDADDADRISKLLFQADILGIDVMLHDGSKYYDYFCHLKSVFRNLKPVARSIGRIDSEDYKKLEELFKNVKMKAFQIDKTPSIFGDDLAQKLFDVSEELDQLHEKLLEELNACGLYIRTVVEYTETNQTSRIKKSSMSSRNKQ